MKPLFKCDYCKFTGTEEEVQKHEVNCPEDYTKRSCYTCQHRIWKSKGIKCTKGNDIPTGKMFVNCNLYERKEKSSTQLTDWFAESLFGGF